MPDAYIGPPRLKKTLNSGSTLLGLWITWHDMQFVESAAHAGFDVLLVDAEHAPTTIEHIEQIAMVTRNAPAQVIVRMPGIDQIAVKQVLDLGIEGIVVPMVNSVDDARRLVDFAMYPPLGSRGIGPRRAQHLVGNAWDYQRAANDDVVVVIPQIEHINAVNCLDDICNVEGIGGLFLGPSDLSLSMGLGGQYDHPDVVAAKDNILAASRKYSLPLGVASVGMDDARDWVSKGAAFVMIAADYGLFRAGADRVLAEIRG